MKRFVRYVILLLFVIGIATLFGFVVSVLESVNPYGFQGQVLRNTCTITVGGLLGVAVNWALTPKADELLEKLFAYLGIN